MQPDHAGGVRRSVRRYVCNSGVELRPPVPHPQAGLPTGVHCARTHCNQGVTCVHIDIPVHRVGSGEHLRGPGGRGSVLPLGADDPVRDGPECPAGAARDRPHHAVHAQPALHPLPPGEARADQQGPLRAPGHILSHRRTPWDDQ